MKSRIIIFLVLCFVNQSCNGSWLSYFAKTEIIDHIRDQDVRAVQDQLNTYSNPRNLYLRSAAFTSLGVLTLYSLFKKDSQSYLSHCARRVPIVAFCGGILSTALGMQALGYAVYGINHQDRAGHTILHYAIQSGNVEIIRLCYDRNIGTPEEREDFWSH